MKELEINAEEMNSPRRSWKTQHQLNNNIERRRNFKEKERKEKKGSKKNFTTN
jgi:hypothetical protein